MNSLKAVEVLTAEGPPELIKLLDGSFSIKKDTRRRRVFQGSVLGLTFFTYMVCNLSRKPITVVKNIILDCQQSASNCSSWITELDGRPEQEAKFFLGVLDVSFLAAYSISMFFSGFLAERMNIRYFLTIGLMLSGILCIFLGLSQPLEIHSLWYFISIQILFGIVQSSVWPGVVSVMGNWFGKGKRGLIMGLWMSHTSIGNILGSLIAGVFVSSNWGLSFIVPGVLVCSMGIIVFLLLVPAPEDINIQIDANLQLSDMTYDGHTQDILKPDILINKDESELEKESAIGFFGALKIPGVVEFALCLFFAKLVKYTFLYWLPNYIYSQSHVNPQNAAFLSTVFDVGGIIGGILAGVITDKTGKSATTCSIMIILGIPTILFYQHLISDICPLQQVEGVPEYNACFYWMLCVLILTGILVNGPYSLITTVVSAELGQHPSLAGSRKALATVTAIIDGTGSLGTTGVLLAGPLSSKGNWEYVIYMLITADFLALLFLTRLVFKELRKQRKVVTEPANASF